MRRRIIRKYMGAISQFIPLCTFEWPGLYLRRRRCPNLPSKSEEEERKGGGGVQEGEGEEFSREMTRSFSPLLVGVTPSSFSSFFPPPPPLHKMLFLPPPPLSPFFRGPPSTIPPLPAGIYVRVIFSLFPASLPPFFSPPPPPFPKNLRNLCEKRRRPKKNLLRHQPTPNTAAPKKAVNHNRRPRLSTFFGVYPSYSSTRLLLPLFFSPFFP